MEVLTDFFANFFDWMEALPAVWAYATLFLIAYGENVVPPIPGDMVVVFAGYMAGVGLLDLWLVIVLSTVGGTAGFMSMYVIGYYAGRQALTSDTYSWLPRSGIKKAQSWMERYGFGVVAANRFLSGARSVISLTVGAAQMKPVPTLWWSAFSSAIWCGLISTGGYFVGDNWRLVVEYVRAYGRWMIVLLSVIAAILAVRWYFSTGDASHKNELRDAPEETPSRETTDLPNSSAPVVDSAEESSGVQSEARANDDAGRRDGAGTHESARSAET